MPHRKQNPYACGEEHSVCICSIVHRFRNIFNRKCLILPGLAGPRRGRYPHAAEEFQTCRIAARRWPLVTNRGAAIDCGSYLYLDDGAGDTPVLQQNLASFRADIEGWGQLIPLPSLLIHVGDLHLLGHRRSRCSPFLCRHIRPVSTAFMIRVNRTWTRVWHIPWLRDNPPVSAHGIARGTAIEDKAFGRKRE